MVQIYLEKVDIIFETRDKSWLRYFASLDLTKNTSLKREANWPVSRMFENKIKYNIIACLNFCKSKIKYT